MSRSARVKSTSSRLPAPASSRSIQKAIVVIVPVAHVTDTVLIAISLFAGVVRKCIGTITGAIPVPVQLLITIERQCIIPVAHAVCIAIAAVASEVRWQRPSAAGGPIGGHVIHKPLYDAPIVAVQEVSTGLSATVQIDLKDEFIRVEPLKIHTIQGNPANAGQEGGDLP